MYKKIVLFTLLLLFKSAFSAEVQKISVNLFQEKVNEKFAQGYIFGISEPGMEEKAGIELAKQRCQTIYALQNHCILTVLSDDYILERQAKDHQTLEFESKWEKILSITGESAMKTSMEFEDVFLLKTGEYVVFSKINDPDPNGQPEKLSLFFSEKSEKNIDLKETITQELEYNRVSGDKYEKYKCINLAGSTSFSNGVFAEQKVAIEQHPKSLKHWSKFLSEAPFYYKRFISPIEQGLWHSFILAYINELQICSSTDKVNGASEYSESNGNSDFNTLKRVKNEFYIIHANLKALYFSSFGLSVDMDVVWADTPPEKKNE